MSTTTISSSTAIMLNYATGFQLIFYIFAFTVFIVLILYFINLGSGK